ncbi:MAG TPA: PDZ domain-containing protein, partial [Kofleriaceae bacterium]|nr:PDZ domain-containing protein [Kofleriaceae bacterium]
PVFRSWLSRPTAVSDVDGGFTIPGLAEGSYAVRARAADDREAIASPVAAGARDVALRLAAASAIEVALVGFATTPAVDAERAGELQNRRGSVDGARAVITGLVPGRYIVTAHNPQELDAAVVDLAAGATGRVTLTSHGSARVTATVRNFTTGAPVAGMQCLVYPTAGGMLGAEPAWDLSAAPSTDAEGQAVIDPAPAGPIAVYCYQPAAGLSSARALLELAPGARAEAQLLTVHLEPPGAGDLGAELDQGYPIAITSVRDDGPAARAGLRAGDQLVALDGVPIEQLSKGGVQFWVRSCRVGARITVTVQRGTDAHTVPVVIGAAQP